MNDSKETLKATRLEHFPIMMFAIIMGFSGLTIVIQKSSSVFNIPIVFSNLFIGADSILFITIFSIYFIKILKYTSSVKSEFSHPIRINFFAASSISMLLLSIIYHQFNTNISFILFFLGTLLQTFFTLYTISFWINNNLEINHSNPAWFIPIVGNVLVPVAGVGFVSNDVLMYYFSIGLFFWIVLTSIIINRIIFHNQLAVKFIPTLFIFIAPPSIAFIAYIKMFNSYDVFAMFLLNMSLFFSILILFMYKNFLHLKFFISWWAFTFPIAAVTLATLQAYHITNNDFYKILSLIFIVLTICIVCFVGIKTLLHIRKKEICISE